MNKFELTVRAQCPVDGTTDFYDAVLVRGGHEVLPVEELLSFVACLTATPVLQEDLTMRLARRFGALVTTVGTHSGVRLTCRVDARH